MTDFDPFEGEEAVPLKRASDLMPRLALSDEEAESLGLDAVAGTYKGLAIVKVGWQHKSHDWQPDSFYVRSMAGTIGWVPWVGSAVVWPWESAWVQDLKDSPLRSNLKKVKS